MSFSTFSELSHDCVNVTKSYRVFSSDDCEECQDVYFSKDLVGCSNCFGCIGLRSKSYCFLNEPVGKEEYQRRLAALDLGSHRVRTELGQKTVAHFLKFPRKATIGRKNTNSSGEYLDHCENVRDSYMVGSGKNVRYAQFIKKGPSAEAYDYSHFAMNAEWIYECCWVGIQVHNIKFSFWNYKCHDLEYCFGCHGSEYLFGCVGVRNGRYCILNKQYSKEEYEALLPKIKEQMHNLPYTEQQGRTYGYGEFLPVEFSPWMYNESNAYEWLPLAEAEAKKFGFGWRAPSQREYQPATVVVPDRIQDVPDNILQGILKCDNCGRNYQLIQSELDFLRRFQIPVPRACPLCRDRARIKRLNPIQIYERTCAKCGRAIQTSYAPDRPEIVYCEQCYNVETV